MGLPLAPSNLAAEAVSARQINLTFDDNSEAVAGVNEVQRIVWSDPPESGTFTLTFDAETTDPIAWDATTTAIENALVATAAFETGDVSVTAVNAIHELDINGATTGYFNYEVNNICLITVQAPFTLARIQAAFDASHETGTWSDLGSGIFRLEFDSQNYSGDAIPEPTIPSDTTGAGVTATRILTGGLGAGFNITYTGGLAAMNVDPISVDATNLRTEADTISVNVTQTGTANIDVEPSIETITEAVPQANEEQQVTIGGATSGTFDLNGNATSATVSTLDATGIQTACDTIWGIGNTIVSDLGAGNFRVTFGGAYANTNVAEMTVSNNSTDGSPSITTTTQGNAGAHQVDEIIFTGGTATAGSCTINGDSCGYNTSAASAVTVIGATVSATTPASGSITVTWDSDYEAHTPVSVATNTLRVEGRKEIFTIELDEEPTEGNFYLKKDEAGDNSYPIEFDDDTTAVDTALESAFPSYPVTVTGGPLPGLITVTSDNNVAPSTWTAHENTALRKGVTADVTTVTQGAPQEWAELGFIIERSDNGEDWEELVDLGVNMESWPDDDSLTALTEYFYRVNAYNGDGSSDWSNTASAMTLAGGNAIAFTSVF